MCCWFIVLSHTRKETSFSGLNFFFLSTHEFLCQHVVNIVRAPPMAHCQKWSEYNQKATKSNAELHRGRECHICICPENYKWFNFKTIGKCDRQTTENDLLIETQRSHHGSCFAVALKNPWYKYHPFSHSSVCGPGWAGASQTDTSRWLGHFTVHPLTCIPWRQLILTNKWFSRKLISTVRNTSWIQCVPGREMTFFFPPTCSLKRRWCSKLKHSSPDMTLYYLRLG